MNFAKNAARLRSLTRGAISNPSGVAINVTHSIYYRTTIQDTWYDGIQILKSPLDLWIYQEILNEEPLDLVIETGTFNGGSALYLAHLMDRLGRGRIISIDTAERERPQHPRIEYVQASSTDPATVARMGEEARRADGVMVILDSDHARDHVLAELRSYADLVTPGHYMIVEDGNVNGHPVYVDHGPGPQEALLAFLTERHDFTIDKTREKFLITMNPNGYLRRD